MKYEFPFFLVMVIVTASIISCSDSSEKDSLVKPKVSSQISEDSEAIKQEEINFVAEETALKEVFTKHADDISEKEFGWSVYIGFILFVV